MTSTDTTNDQHETINVAILVGPGYNPVDMIGPHTVLGLLPGVALHLVWKDTEEVMGFPTFPTRPTTRFDDCPDDLDVLYVPAMPPAALEDAEMLDFLADRGSRARWVAGSCVGSLILGAAGLLQGYRATTNFQCDHLLHYFGATLTPGNVVEDRNRITAGPATGGFEIAFRLVQDIWGDDVAREAILQAEYAPQPLFHTGSPKLAGPEMTDRARARFAPLNTELEQACRKAAARL